MTDIEKFREEPLSKEKLHSSLTDRKITGKEHEHNEMLSDLVFKT